MGFLHIADRQKGNNIKEFYIRIDTYGTNAPHLVDEEQIYQAERHMNYLNADEFMFFCEADCLHDAKAQYWEEFSRMANESEGERYHP